MNRIIALIESKLKEQEDTIAIQKYQIEKLTEKLSDAEKNIFIEKEIADE